jgi:hypothetical protein
MIFTEGLKNLYREVANKRPQIGMRVRVIGTRKHKGKEGKIFWHGEDRYYGASRYGDNYQQMMRQCMGRHGYRVGIETESGEKFFVKADHQTIELIGIDAEMKVTL